MTGNPRGTVSYRLIAWHAGDGPTIWEPLDLVVRLCRQRPELPQPRAEHFMYMGRLEAARIGHTVHLYKHLDTRRYLCLDAAGHAFRLNASPPGERHSGAWELVARRRHPDPMSGCRPVRDLASALRTVLPPSAETTSAPSPKQPPTGVVGTEDRGQRRHTPAAEPPEVSL